jgi:stearoyl-CoA desaturase (delta-9 desaturase)
LTALQTPPRHKLRTIQAKSRHPLPGEPLHTFRKLDPTNTIAIVAMHVFSVGAFFLPFHWYEIGLTALLWWVCGGLGICLCYHRLLTHRSFKTPRVVEYFLTLLGTTCWQGGPIKWVGTHRIHHKHSDGEEDPHSPHHGFNWAHIFWCMMKEPPDYFPRDAAKDLQRDKVMVLIDKYHYVPQFAVAAFLMVIGWAIGGPLLGLAWVVWGVCIRTIFTFHATWFVNSAAHTWGYQTHETGDDSRNNWWVALLSFGEGWHNNHHHSQRTAAHGQRWWEIDLTYWTIKAMSWVGLAREIVPVKG